VLMPGTYAEALPGAYASKSSRRASASETVSPRRACARASASASGSSSGSSSTGGGLVQSDQPARGQHGQHVASLLLRETLHLLPQLLTRRHPTKATPAAKTGLQPGDRQAPRALALPKATNCRIEGRHDASCTSPTLPAPSQLPPPPRFFRPAPSTPAPHIPAAPCSRPAAALTATNPALTPPHRPQRP